MLKVTISLPKPGASDVASRELRVSLNGGEATKTELEKDALEASFTCDASTKFSITLVDIDASGNRSPESSALEGTAEDTFAPPAPGALGVLNVQEV